MNVLLSEPSSEKKPTPMMIAAVVLVMVTPVFLTSAGSRGSAVLTRFCTSTAARSLSRSTSNVTVMMLVPSLPLVELM